MIRKYLILSMIVGLLMFLGSASAHAQLIPDASEVKETVIPEIPDDSLGRRTPRGTVSGFIQAISDQNISRAAEYLNLSKSQKKERERERLVKIFQQLLDQGGNIMPYSWISNATSGRTDDDLPAGSDLVGTIDVGGESISLFVENKQSQDQPPLWQFSRATINSLSAQTLGEQRLLDRTLPSVLIENMVAGVPLGHWLALIILIVVAYYGSWLIIAGFNYLLRLLWKKAGTEPTAGVITALELPFRLYLAVWVFVILSQEIGASIIVRQRFSGVTIIIGFVALLLLLYRLTNVISSFSVKRMTKRGRLSALSIVLFLKRAAKVAIVIFGIIGILSILGFDVTTGLAALGIGGIALALGAQKTMENFVGSVTVLADQPIRVGDFCTVGQTTGTVESIGMRSTRIRTANRTIVTIPNGEFSSTRIENFAPRDQFLFNPILDLRYETSPDQIRFLLVELRAILYAHPKVNPEPARIRFVGFGDWSLKLEVYSYITTANYDEFLEVREDILLRMMDVIKMSGTDFAFPSQTLYLGRDSGLPEDQTRQTEETVKQWRDQSNMQLPNYDTEKIETLKGSIVYPPEGTAAFKASEKVKTSKKTKK